MAVTRTPRRSWVDAGLRALAEGGVDAVRVEAVARELGVTKGGFYWHFTDRGSLLDEMLDTWERVSIDDVIERVEAAGGDARSRFWRLSGEAMENQDLLRVDLAIRDWARREPSVAKRLRHIDNRRMEYMRSLFRAFCIDEDDVEIRCTIAFALWIGNHFIAADHGGRSREEMLLLAITRLVA